MLSEYYNNRGYCYDINAQPTEAIADYEQSIILNPDSGSFLFLNDLYLKENRLEDGIKFYSKAITLNSKKAVFYANRASNYNMLEQYGKAIDDYTKAITLKPDDIYYYSLRAYSYMWLKQYNKAIEDYSKVIKLRTNKYYYDYTHRADVFIEMKQYDKALKDYDKAIEIAPSNMYWSLYLDRGKLKEKMKDNFGALDDYSEACNFEKENNGILKHACSVYSEFDKKIARGERWESFGSSDKVQWFYDKTSTKKQSNKNIRVWIRTETDDTSALIEKRKTLSQKTDGYENYSHSLNLWEYDCNGGNVGTISAVDYGNKGKTLESFDLDPKFINMRPIVPESMGDALYEIVCKSQVEAK